MATSLLALSLLVLSATQGSSAELDQREAVMITLMQGVGESLVCLGDAVKDLHVLPNMILQLKEQVTKQNDNIELMKKEVTFSHKGEDLVEECQILEARLKSKDETVEILTRDIQELRTQFENKLQTEESLNKYIKDLNHHIVTKDAKVELLTETNAAQEKELEDKNEKVDDLNRRLQESQLRIQELENTVQMLNNTVETNVNERGTHDCPPQPDFKDLVQEFVRTGQWGKMRTGLEAVLNQSSESYKQLRSIGYKSIYPLYWVGYQNKTHLASLLLCGGLPVDSRDSDGDTMLLGAAKGGHLHLVKMLLDHGANVNKRVRGSSTPLIEAAVQGHLEVVRMLVQAGADTTAKDRDQETALDRARIENKVDVVSYLETLLY